MPIEIIKHTLQRAGIVLTALLTSVTMLLPPAADALESSTPPVETQTTTSQTVPVSEETTVANEMATTVVTEPVSTNEANNPPVIDTSVDDTEPTPANTSEASALQDTTAVVVPPEPGTNATIMNDVAATSQSGDTTVEQNHTVGDATTGDSATQATLLNTVNSSTSFTNGASPLYFNYDISDDVSGDLLIHPEQLADVQSASTPSPGITVNPNGLQTTATINNSIDLNAISGNTTATDNHEIGYVSSGSASAVANVINVLNSAIVVGQSFIGSVNIFGNFTGDILIPSSFLDGLFVANSSSTSPATTSDTTATIANDINASAASGSVSATDNGTLGDVLTGDALTSVKLINITGSSIGGGSTLLVFVNVLGNWVGTLFNASAGTTQGTISGGNGSTTTTMPSVSATSNAHINNTINVRAQSGDVVVAGNGHVGTINSGNAYAAVNVLNIVQSHIAASEWFGILFINVFGNWYGNLAAVPEIQTETEAPISQPAQPTNSTPPSPVFSFIPRTSRTTSPDVSNTSASSTSSSMNTASRSTGSTLSAEDVQRTSATTTALATPAQTSPRANSSTQWLWLALIPVGMVAIGLLIRRYYAR